MNYQRLLRDYWRECVLAALLLATLFVWLRVYQAGPGPLRVYFLDVGQGDAILVETPSHKRFLLDGGPNKRVVTEMGKALPFGARTIDLVIQSHPDGDHIGGLPEVLERYKVGLFLEPGVESENDLDDELRRRLVEKDIQRIIAKRGMAVDFGDGARLTILFPDRDVSAWDTNDASVVARLDYGESSFLLTGDAALKTEQLLLTLDPASLDTDVLKAGHHGSRTSTSAGFATAVSPAYAVISAGRDNTYGHPHTQVLDVLQKVRAEIKSTAESGTIIFESDGKTLRIK